MDHYQQYILLDSKVQNEYVKETNLQYLEMCKKEQTVFVSEQWCAHMCVPKAKICIYK